MNANPRVFDGPLGKVRRAKSHIQELEHKLAGWGPFPSDHMLPPPGDIKEIVGDAIHNMRAALDLMASELVQRKTGKPKKVYFPFANSESALTQMIRQKGFHHAGKDAVAILKSLRPYSGGNKMLRAIHDLDIQDKHHLPIDLAIKSKVRLTANITGNRDLAITDVKVSSINSGQLRVFFREASPFGEVEVVETLHALVDTVEGILELFAALCRPS